MRLLSELGQNLRLGLRLALMLPLGRGEFRYSFDQLFGLASVAGLVLGLLDFIYSLHPPGERYFLPGGVYSIGALALLLVAVATLAARFHDRSVGGFLPVAVACVAALPLPISVFYVVQFISQGDMPPGILWVIWGAAIFARIQAKQLPGANGLGTIGGIVIASLALGAAVQLSLPVFWYVYDPSWAEELRQDPIDVETTYYRQPILIDEALAELHTQRAGREDLYFLGFAGGSDDVFASEVGQARAIVDERLGLAGRSLALINNRQSIDDVPLANAHNLRRALAGLAGIIDSEEDVLVLFLSSHGSKDHQLSIDFHPFAMNDLPAATLAAALNESGIQWRIVIVSACYSGGFIEPLRDPRTIVMTSARADRTSFGCGSEREWTYFGEAYFRDALAQTGSLLESFDRARDAIAERELAEERTPSEPQIFVGELIRAKLRRIEAAGSIARDRSRR